MLCSPAHFQLTTEAPSHNIKLICCVTEIIFHGKKATNSAKITNICPTHCHQHKDRGWYKGAFIEFTPHLDMGRTRANRWFAGCDLVSIDSIQAMCLATEAEISKLAFLPTFILRKKDLGIGSSIFSKRTCEFVIQSPTSVWQTKDGGL